MRGKRGVAAGVAGLVVGGIVAVGAGGSVTAQTNDEPFCEVVVKRGDTIYFELCKFPPRPTIIEQVTTTTTTTIGPEAVATVADTAEEAPIAVAVVKTPKFTG